MMTLLVPTRHCCFSVISNRNRHTYFPFCSLVGLAIVVLTAGRVVVVVDVVDVVDDVVDDADGSVVVVVVVVVVDVVVGALRPV